MLLTAFMLAAGLVLLIVGAEALVRGSSRLAIRLGVAPVVVGLTVVAFGTSSPELFVSAKAAVSGRADLSLGNVVGSNILNVLFILGASASLAPLLVTRKLIWTEVPIMVAASGLMILMGLDGRISRLDGSILIFLLGAYVWMQIRLGRKEGNGIGEAAPKEGAGRYMGVPACIGLVVGGLVALVWGAAWLLDAAVTLARAIGLSELVIGLTIVAAGTSLPEVATSLLASWRGQQDIAVGNVIGSCIFNVLGVLGVSAVISAQGVAVSPAALFFDIPVMIAAAVACLPIFLTGHVINRGEGVLFLFYYAAYTAYLILAVLQHDALSAFSLIMLAFVIPLTFVTLAVMAFRHIKTRPRTG
jgi:cation:H+ antiporter